MIPLGQGWLHYGGSFHSSSPGLSCALLPSFPRALTVSPWGDNTTWGTWEPLEFHQNTPRFGIFAHVRRNAAPEQTRAQNQNFPFNPGPLLRTH